MKLFDKYPLCKILYGLEYRIERTKTVFEVPYERMYNNGLLDRLLSSPLKDYAESTYKMSLKRNLVGIEIKSPTILEVTFNNNILGKEFYVLLISKKC